MPNKIAAVEAVKREMRTGWPYGASEAYKRIPVLLERIAELESALVPFASTARKNFNVVRDDEMVPVYMKNLVRALEFMDETNSARTPVEDFGIPAE